MAEDSKAIKYRIYYKNDAGEIIAEIQQFKPFPKLKTTEEEYEGSSVFEIVTYVANRQLAMGKHVTNSKDAVDASAELGDSKREAEDQTDHSKELESENLEILSVNKTEMVIRSPYLLKAIWAVAKYHPHQRIDGTAITVPEPYHSLLHHRKDLK